MKRVLLSSAVVIAASMCSPAFADSTNANVEDHYRTVVREIPHNEKVCQTVDVPIYGNGGKEFDQNSAIIGGIIGGVIGNQFGGGSGKEAATGIGALSGAIIGGNRTKPDQIVGYRQETRCHYETTYTTKREEVYDYSTITFKHDGRKYVVRFTR